MYVFVPAAFHMPFNAYQYAQMEYAEVACPGVLQEILIL